MEVQMKSPVAKIAAGKVHCPMCTHSVPGNVAYTPRHMKVVPGQKCERCGTSLDVAVVLYLRNAA
jgi:hypothetical protein